MANIGIGASHLANILAQLHIAAVELAQSNDTALVPGNTLDEQARWLAQRITDPDIRNFVIFSIKEFGK